MTLRRGEEILAETSHSPDCAANEPAHLQDGDGATCDCDRPARAIEQAQREAIEEAAKKPGEICALIGALPLSSIHTALAEAELAIKRLLPPYREEG